MSSFDSEMILLLMEEHGHSWGEVDFTVELYLLMRNC